MRSAAPFIAFGVMVALIRIRGRGQPRANAWVGVAPRVKALIISAWVLGGVGIIGASVDERLEIALIPAGLMLVAAGFGLRGYRPPNRGPQLAWLLPVATVIIGLGWTAIGVLEAVSLAQA